MPTSYTFVKIKNIYTYPTKRNIYIQRTGK